MARISKAEHPRILHLVDVERRKVAEVATEYECTPANIYALLAKLRRAEPAPADDAVPAPAVTEAAPAPVEAPAVDLFAASWEPAPVAERLVPPSPPPAPAPAPVPASAPIPPPASAPISATVTPLSRRDPAPRGAVGARLAKPGFGLAMRTGEDEESVTPFRSLEDLLSAVKPLLRTAARSPEPVWFSIRPVDLAEVESDAA